jgi:hypothetical protein
MSSDTSYRDLIAPVLLSGEWVCIGHESEIKLEGDKLLHRLDDEIIVRDPSWLVDDLSLLNWILSQKSD